MFSSLAKGISRIKNLPMGRDVLQSLACTHLLGVRPMEGRNQLELFCNFVPGFPRTLQAICDMPLILDCGNSGTTMRLLGGLLAHFPGGWRLVGDQSLMRRPMNRLIIPLQKMGMPIQATDGHAPLEIGSERRLVSCDIDLQVPSAQVKSALMLAAMACPEGSTIKEQFSTRDHSEKMLKLMGAPMTFSEDYSVTMGPLKSALGPIQTHLPGDPSSAAFLGVAALLLPGSNLILKDILLNPTRIAWVHLLIRAGAKIRILNQQIVDSELRGDVEFLYSNLSPISPEAEHMAHYIDEIPILAVAASQADGDSHFLGIAELRTKESDRVHAIVSNLRKMGVSVDELKDGFVVHGKTSLRGCPITSFGDHRIAMAFSVGSLLCKEACLIDDSKCVDISFPEYYKTIKSLLKSR